MAHYNKCIFIGNLGKDPEVRQTQDGKDIASISIGVTESWKDKASGERKSKTEWVRVVLFGSSATFTKDYLKKGSLVQVEGSFQTRKWTDKQGVEKYTSEIVVQGFKGGIQSLGSKSDKQENASNIQDDSPILDEDLNNDIPF